MKKWRPSGYKRMNFGALLKKFCGFSIIGGISTVLSIGLIFLFNDCFGWHAQVSYALSYLMTIAFSYAMNARYVFRRKLSWQGLSGFLLVYLGGMVAGLGVLAIYMLLFPNVRPSILSILTIPVTMLGNYLLVDKIIFGDILKCRSK